MLGPMQLTRRTTRPALAALATTIPLEERRNVEVGAALVVGLYSVATLGTFATGNYKLGYTMSMVGGLLGAIFGALRLWASYDEQIAAQQARLP